MSFRSFQRHLTPTDAEYRVVTPCDYRAFYGTVRFIFSSSSLKKRALKSAQPPTALDQVKLPGQRQPPLTSSREDTSTRKLLPSPPQSPPTPTPRTHPPHPTRSGFQIYWFPELLGSLGAALLPPPSSLGASREEAVFIRSTCQSWPPTDQHHQKATPSLESEEGVLKILHAHLSVTLLWDARKLKMKGNEGRVCGHAKSTN